MDDDSRETHLMLVLDKDKTKLFFGSDKKNPYEVVWITQTAMPNGAPQLANVRNGASPKDYLKR